MIINTDGEVIINDTSITDETNNTIGGTITTTDIVAEQGTVNIRSINIITTDKNAISITAYNYDVICRLVNVNVQGEVKAINGSATQATLTITSGTFDPAVSTTGYAIADYIDVNSTISINNNIAIVTEYIT